MEKVGDLAAVWRYPVKSLRGESLASAQVEKDGLPGDRASALIVRDGHVRIGKTLRGKEHERLHLMDTPAQAVSSSAERGITVDVRSDEAPYFDDSPISIVVDRWLEGLNAHVGYAVEYNRFRPNFFVRADPNFRALETDLIGRELVVGEVRLSVRNGNERCVVVTYDLSGGSDDPRVLRYIAQERNNVMGIYCDVLKTGRVQVGDTLYLL